MKQNKEKTLLIGFVNSDKWIKPLEEKFDIVTKDSQILKQL